MFTEASSIISLVALIYYSALLFIVGRQDIRSRVRLYFSLYLVSMIVWSFSALMIFLQVTSVPTVIWNRLLIVGSMAMPVTLFGFIEAFLMRERRIWLYIGVASYFINQILNVTGLVVVRAEVANGLLINEYGPGLVWSSLSWLFFIGFSTFELIREYRRTKDSAYRNRLRYLILVVLVILIGNLTNLTDLKMMPGDVAANIIAALLITYAILRHQLLDFSFVLRKGLLHSIPSLLIVASYYLVFFLALTLFHSISGFQVFIISLIVAVITAMIVQPLRDKTQSWIDRIFFPEKYDAGQMLQRISRTTAYVLDLSELTDMILADVTSTLHIKRAAFFIREKEGSEFVLIAHKGQTMVPNFRFGAEHPIVQTLSKTDHAITDQDLNVMPQFRSLWENERGTLNEIGADLLIPLRAKGELIGILGVGPRHSGETYSQDDQLTLTTLANQTAVVFESARLYTAEQTRREELDTLYNLTRKLIATDDVDSVLESTIYHIVQSVHVTYARILIFDEPGILHCKAIYPVRDLEFELGLGRVEPELALPYYWTALREKQNIVLTKNDPTISDEAREALLMESASNLCICPLFTNERARGLIVLGEARRETREPFDSDKLRLISAIADQTASALQRAYMHEQMEKSFLETVLALANAMDARDTYTNNHSQRLAYLAETMCWELNFNEEEIRTIRWAALLHDIGKIGVPDEILRKPGALLDNEWEVMKRHPEIGANIVAPVKELSKVAPLIRAHQERFDGKGYPDRLKGKEIPVGARILAIVDAFGAMTDYRVYRKRRTNIQAIEELRRCKGTQFDPELVEVFIKILERDATRPLGPLPDYPNDRNNVTTQP